jgi:hypothetical protein
MNIPTKLLTLTIIAILTLSSMVILTAKPANAQTPTKPSVPVFSIKLVDSSYDVPPDTTVTVDQYTGEKTTNTRHGYRVNQITAEITIKNQLFTAYTNENGRKINLYYKFDVKGHFGEDWESSMYYLATVVQSESDYTILPYVVTQNAGSKLDFKVQAIVGYEYDSVAESGSSAGMFGVTAWVVQSLESSGWSNTQTITIPDMFSSPSFTNNIPSQNPNTTPQTDYKQSIINVQPKDYLTPINILICIVALFMGIITALTIILLLKRHSKASNLQNINSSQTNN